MIHGASGMAGAAIVMGALMVGDAPIDPEKQFLDREEIQHAVDTMNQVIAATPREQRDRVLIRVVRVPDLGFGEARFVTRTTHAGAGAVRPAPSPVSRWSRRS